MLRLIRPATIAGVSIAVLALAGCATLRVNSYLERAADFTRYRSYAWAERGDFSTGDPRLDNNRFFSQRVEEAVDMQLAARGLEKTSAGAADLLIHIHMRVDQRIDTAAFDPHDQRCVVEECQPDVYDAGTLMVDLMDRRTDRLAWRGWAEGSFDGVIDNQEWMETTIDKTVARILARLPRPQ
jgi:uncharacterized protein DUF4136